METDTDPEAAGLKAIYGRSSSKNFVSEWYTSVSYHDPHPVWNEEIKIKYAIALLFFCYFHIGMRMRIVTNLLSYNVVNDTLVADAPVSLLSRLTAPLVHALRSHAHRLPPRLTPSLHLLFSFYHISCKTKDKRLQSGDKESVDDLPALIGHAFLPVLSVDPDTLRLSNRALADEESDLPVTHTIAPGYLNPTNGAPHSLPAPLSDRTQRA